MFCINIKQIVERCLAEAVRFWIVDLAPEIQVIDCKEIKKEFVVVFHFWQELQDFYLLAILFEMFDKLFDIIVFLPVFHAENDTKGVGVLVRRAGTQAFIPAQCRLRPPF